MDSANFQPIRNTSQIWVVKRHQYKEFLRSFLRRHRGDTRDGVATRRLLSQAKALRANVFKLILKFNLQATFRILQRVIAILIAA